jgi:hypothetical protein
MVPDTFSLLADPHTPRRIHLNALKRRGRHYVNLQN